MENKRTALSLFALFLCLALSAQETVTGEGMKKDAVNSSLDALNGRVAGVTVSRGNSEAMLNTVRVRGTTSLTGGNDPLVIIDGVSSDLSVLNTIYPADIESFTILKDASETAEFGSRGASGVIVVSTKKASSGLFKLAYDGTYGLESVSKELRMMSASDFLSASAALGYTALDMGYDSDFQKAITRTGTVANHHFSLSGGAGDASYRASLGIMDHDMVVRGNGYTSYYAKLDISQLAYGGAMRFDIGLVGSLRRESLIHDTQKLFYSAEAFNPTFPTVKNASGSWDSSPTSSQLSNPLALLEKRYDTSTANFNVHLSYLWKIASWLSFNAFGSYSYNSDSDSRYFPTFVWAQGEAYREAGQGDVLLGNASLKGSWTLDGVHSLSLTFLTEAQKERYSAFHTTVNGFTSNDFLYYNLSAGSTRLWSGTGSSYIDPALVSFMAAGEYSFRDIASLKATVRTDASSKFGANNKWGFFPSVSGKLHLRPLLRLPEWIQSLDLSLGAGTAGNQDALDPYYTLSMLSPIGIVSADGVERVALGYTYNVNPDLRWEVRRSVNAGVDGTFFDSRLSLSLAWYYSRTSDMLYSYSVSVPPFPYPSLMANLGAMSNEGLELGLGAILVQEGDFEVNLSGNLSFQKNTLLSLSGWYGSEYITAPDIVPISSLNGAGQHGGYNNVVYQIVGQPLGVFYLPHCTGLGENADGSRYYEIEDLNGAGVSLSDGQDRYIAGQAMPKALLGVNLSLRYREFDLSAQFNGAFGHKIYNGTALSYNNLGSLPYYNVLRGADKARINDLTATDWYLEPGDYLNIDYITLGWNVPRRWKQLSSLRLSLSVGNLATLTRYSGLTPMINSSVADGTLGVDDKNIYPVYRTFSLGLGIQF